MKIHKKIFFYIGTLLLFSSCGQVGSITGGEKDVTAPRMVISKVNPPNYSIAISPEKITIPFDEFIELNKPSENIRITPNDVKLDAKIHRKSLVLTKTEGEWQPNTTYTIYLNRVVRDITERNDSILSYVFSTGVFLDSLQTAIQVIDAYKGDPVADVTVGLYTEKLIEDTNKVSPRYFAVTDKKGVAVFQNIKNQEYFAYAFQDENRNNRLDATEKRAAYYPPVELHAEDTIERTYPIIRLMPPEEKELKISSNEVLPPAAWCLGFNRALHKNEDFLFLDSTEYIIWSPKRDSVTAFFKTDKKSGNMSGILISENKSDTINKKYFFQKTTDFEIKTNLKNNKLGVIDTLKFLFNEPYNIIDNQKIVLSGVPKNDSISHEVYYSILAISPLEIGVLFERREQEKLFLSISPDGISGINSVLKDSIKLEFSLQTKRETGTMILEFDTIPPYGILFIKKGGDKEEIEVIFDGIEKNFHQIDYLEPGEYSFYYLLDEDKNGKWSTGSIFTEKEAEKIIWFTTKSTIRANWEVKAGLKFKLEEKPRRTQRNHGEHEEDF